jgi:hypothetical protein
VGEVIPLFLVAQIIPSVKRLNDERLYVCSTWKLWKVIKMIETALDSFKNRATESSFTHINIECKHKLDMITLRNLGFSANQSNQVFRVLNDGKTDEFTLHEFQKITPEDLLTCVNGNFSAAISVWILFETLIAAHNTSCAEDSSEYLDVSRKPGNFTDDSVEELNFSVRTLNVLRKEKITNVSILSRYSREELLDLPNLGVSSVNEIEADLERRGFRRTSKSELQLNAQIDRDLPLSQLNLSTRTFNGLMRSQITVLSDLMSLSYEEVRDIRQLGEKSISEVMYLQEKYKKFFSSSLSNNFEFKLRNSENGDWARKKLTQELTEIQETYGEILNSPVHQLSLEYFDHVSGALISKVSQEESFTISDICELVTKTLTKVDSKIDILSLVNLISVMRNSIESNLLLRDEIKVSTPEREAFSKYDSKYANDFIELFEFDDCSLVTLGFDSKETRGFLGKQSFFELVEMLQTQIVTYELPWEIVKEIKVFFNKYGAFPNIAGLVIAAALSDDQSRREIREIFRRFFEIARPEYADRDSLIVMLRIQKKTLDQIGQEVGLTRERVRQIIKRISPTLEAIIEYLVLEREGSFSPVSEEIFRTIFHEYGAVYLSELAALLKLEENKVLARTPRKFHKFIIDKSIPPVFISQWSKEDVIGILRKAGTYYFPLKTSDYEYLLEIGEISGPSVPYIYNKYDSWTEMCILAGVEPAASMRGEYVLLWNEDELISYLQRYLLEDGTTGTASGYDEWREEQHDHVPSGVLIRNQFERWSDARRIALEGIRISKGKAVKR